MKRKKSLLIYVVILCCLLGVAASAEPASTCSLSIADGMPALTFSVFPTEERDPEWVEMIQYRLEITTQDGRALPTLTFPSLEGAEQQTHLLNFVDFNFDGYLDIEAVRAARASNMRNTHFLYHPDTGEFVYTPVLDALSGYQLFPGQRLILTYEHDSAATGVYSLFVIADGEPTLFREASMLYKEGDDAQTIRLLVTEYSQDGQETTLMDQSYAPFEEGAYDGWYDAAMDALWKGADPSEKGLNPYLFYNPQGGAYYHSDPECNTISPKYRTVIETFDRGQLFQEPFSKLKPCPACCANEVE